MLLKSTRPLALAVLLAALFSVPVAVWPTAAQSAEEAVSPIKTGWYHQRVSAEFVAKYAILPKPDNVQIIDSRPTARKYDPGHIPTALSIPDSQFDKLVDLLPKDKSSLLIFYCDGLECMLSHNSAFRAEKLGYSNIRVYADGYPDWLKSGHIGAVSVPYIKKLIDEKAPMTLIDSRPKERKFDKGHIPGAISIPDLQFDKLVDRLPTDKSSPLYFYCDGLNCKLSSDSAAKAVKLGYSAVKIVPEGYPAWEKLYGPGPTADTTTKPATPAIQAGKESGTISVASFEKIHKEAPATIHLIDVRDPAEFASGTFKGAINFPINTLEKRIDELPTDKPIVFFCGTSARSGEAHDMTKLYKPSLQTYFLDADIKWSKDGSYTIVEKK
ncbi:MAG TPA: rhodanese-like domain-containing protein [Accumulibacter sp.]|nr:rhodanese-like domain-containing protein [Accumulibacter sp.]HMW16243.1 rhodanese-like domain-containing protein [Accumulibacter sp.]HMY05622.1 rhodanese-like domain-containing protein [Accumulibacter sp.]HND79560.1 rhodanese-like domain-containing protein [Accumulibacter sp.]HNH24449.1 rhodanese-like domain-containing protein [Accumulibacter sp.]